MNERYVQNYSMQEKLIKSRMEIIKSEGIELGRNEGIELGRNEGIELGRNEGIRVEKLKIAKKMMENGKSNEEIIKYTNLSLDELNKLNS